MAITKEQAKELLKELLQMEEKNNIGNLTTRERREFQSIVEDWMNEKYIHLETPNGIMLVEKDDNPDYPAILVGLDIGGEIGVIDIANVECDTTKQNTIKTTVWSNAQSEEYTHQIELENLEAVKEETKELEERE